MNAAIFISLVCVFALASGCKKQAPVSSSHGHSHGAGDHGHPYEEGGGEHAHEEKTAQITVWSNGYEIFAEHTAPVVGQPARFITHVSDTATGTPRTEGMVKFVLTKGNESFDHPQARPERAGIYIPAITFPAPGDWNMKVIIPGGTNTTVDLGSIRVFKTVDEGAHAEFPEAPEGVSFLKEQQWRIALKTLNAESRNITNSISVPGTVVPAPGMSATVYPTISGTITDSVIELGSKVNAGEVIAWLTPVFNEAASRLLEAQAEAIRTEAQATQLQQAYERVKALHAQRAKSDRELQEAETAHRGAQASNSAAKAVLGLFQSSGVEVREGALRIGIISPIDGTLEAAYRHAGERVEPDQPAYRVINSAKAHVEARITPALLPKTTSNAGAFFVLNDSRERTPLTPISTSQVIDPVTRVVTAVYRVEVNPGLRVGSYGKVLMPAQVSTNAVVVPTSAIVDEDGVPVVFVQVSGETFEKRDVTVGVQDHQWTEINLGITEGERVVSEGAYPLLLSTKSGTIPAHGHAH